MYKPNPLDELLGGLSPMASDNSRGSVSFAGGKPSKPQEASSEMSIDSMSTSSTRRAPLGEMQNTFEFKPQQRAQPQKPAAAAPASKTFNFTSGAGAGGFSSKQPFTFGGGGAAAPAPAKVAAPAAPAPAAEPVRMFGRAMQQQAAAASPEPATPASITSEMRGGGGPPLTTLASLSKMGGGAGVGAASNSNNSDATTAVTPVGHMPASHVPLSNYNSADSRGAGASAAAAAAAAVAAASSFSTPEPGASASAAGKKAGSKVVWADILMWRSPLQTATVFLAGAAGFWLLNFAAYGAHSMTLMSAVSYLLIADLFCNFFRYFVSKGWHEQGLWGGAAQMKHFLTSLNAHVLHLAAAHDRFLSAADPFVTLKVAGGLWAAAWVGTFLSLWWTVVLGYVAAFTVPVTYSMCKPRLQALGKSVRAHTIDRVDAMGLPRTVRFLVCVLGVATLWLTSSVTQSAIGFFVACTYWRTLLAPREIDAFRTVAEPYTISALKVGRRISTAAGDAFDRMSTAGPKSRTKSHFGVSSKQRMD